MVIVSILLSIILAAIAVNLVLDKISLTSSEDGKVYSAAFDNAISDLYEAAEELGGTVKLADITALVDSWGTTGQHDEMAVGVYENEERVYAAGAFNDTTLLTIAQYQYFVLEDTAVHYQKVGNYDVYLLNMAYIDAAAVTSEYNYKEADLVSELAVFAVIIFAVLFTNVLLTRFIVRSINKPLNILADGVHELRDGNLSYHINYKGKDEFSEICEDFNEMARQLKQLMDARRKDDSNRRELIAGISHDLRTPLTAIKAYVEGLEQGIADSPEMQKEYLNTIKHKTNDLEHIVRQLFLFSKLDIGEFPFVLKNIDIGKEVKHFISEVKDEYADRGLEIALDEVVENVTICVDTVQLNNVFTNVLENSIKYGDKKPVQVKINCICVGAYVFITLEDNGPGIPDDQIDNIFNAFYREDKARTNPSKGSGLGLAISSKIVERLGGYMRAANGFHDGLSMMIALPIIAGGMKNEQNTNR